MAWSPRSAAPTSWSPAIAARFELTIANDNAPGQVILSGDAEKVGEARKAIRAEGAKAIRLPVAGAFHSPLMEPAIAGYREALAAPPTSPRRSPPSTPRSASLPFEDIRAELLAALTEPVRWRPALAPDACRRRPRLPRDRPRATSSPALVGRTLEGEEFEARSLAEPPDASRA